MATGQSSYSSTGGTTYFDLTTDTGDRAEINDALFFQTKPDDSSGTGLIQAIVRVQDPGNGDGFENGYNSSSRPVSYEENTSPQFTTSLVLNSVPIVTIDGVQYYEFRLDINQLSGDASHLSLDAVKIYTSDVSDGQAEGLISGTWFNDNATLRYNMDELSDNSVLLDATNSTGSGTSDMFLYVPVSDFGGVDPDVTYVTLYSEFGSAGTLDAGDGLTPLDDPANTALEDDGIDTGDVASAIFGTYAANDGFEEWSVSKQTGGVITGFKFGDTDGDGQWSIGEVGLAGWTIDYEISYISGKGAHQQTVTLTGSVITSDGTTDVDGDGDVDPAGFYAIFVPASTDKKETYTVTLTEQAQSGFINTYDGDGTPNYTTTFTFSGDDLTIGGSPNISGAFGVTDTMNFGNFELFEISGHKYTDITGDGLSSDDTGLGGVTVFIDVDGNNIDDDGFSAVTSDGSTDANGDGVIDEDDVGYWEITGLDNTVAGKEVKEITPDGYVQTVGQVGTVTDTSSDYTLGTTDQDNIDFANFELFDISGHKYTDITGDGLSSDDTGLGGVTVFIDVDGNGLDDDGYSTVTADGTTDADGDGDIDDDDKGYFEFTDLDASVAGAELKEITPDGFVQTVGQIGSVTDTEYLITGTSGTDQGDFDFANFELFDISGHKYTDITGDGLSSDDTGLGGVTVFIDVDGNGLDDDGYSTVTADGTTDANHDGVIDEDDVGYWELTNLDNTVAGAEVKEITPTGYVQTVGQIGVVTDTSSDYTLDGTSGADQDDIDFANFLPDPKIDIEKYVKTDISGVFEDQDDPDGPRASTSTKVDFKVVVTNTGNESVSGIALADTVDHDGVDTNEVIDYNAINAQIDIDNDGTIDGLFSDYDEDGDGTLDDADGDFTTVDDFILAVGDSFAVFYSLDSALGQHQNTASVEAVSAISDTIVSDADDANYYVVEEDCVGVRTPGFWSNTKWATFWDGKGEGWGTPANEPKQAGTPGFASGELLYATDSNDDGFINFKAGDGINDDKPLDGKGLLIGDYNMNGFTDVDEDTIFISLGDATKLINASSKQLVDGKTADGIYMLGRDMVATWLNYLANNEESTGNCIGPVADDGVTSVREYLNGAIDWMQALASDDNNNGGDDQSIFQFDPRVAPSSANWQSAIGGVPFSGAEMHSQLDYYNNTGKIFDGLVGGVPHYTEYCCDADSEVALSVLAQINLI